MVNKFPVNEERKAKIKEALRDENYQIYLLSELLEILTSKEAQSESLAAAKYYKATSIAKILKESLA